MHKRAQACTVGRLAPPTVGVDELATKASDQGRDVARPLQYPGMKDQFVEIHDILRAFGRLVRASYSSRSLLLSKAMTWITSP
jgi:hypothetical protein